MKGAGDTLDRLKDEPKDTLALLAVKGRLDQLSRLYSYRSSSTSPHRKKFILQNNDILGEATYNHTYKN